VSDLVLLSVYRNGKMRVKSEIVIEERESLYVGAEVTTGTGLVERGPSILSY
jgi:hypothetical protein